MTAHYSVALRSKWKFCVSKRNQSNGNHWIAICLIGTTSNRDGVVAIITTKTGNKTQISKFCVGSSFILSNLTWPTSGLEKYCQA